jgi:four helix bundle protein
VNSNYNIPPKQRRTQQLVAQFNADEERWFSLESKRSRRRKLHPRMSAKLRRRLGDQLLRSGTSVGAHFREAQRAKSNPDFISKIEGGMQELEETAYWLELLEGARLCGRDQLEPLTNEADQLMAIFVTIVRKTKAGMAKRKF